MNMILSKWTIILSKLVNFKYGRQYKTADLGATHVLCDE